MLQHLKWMRLRGRWVCTGIGTICLTGLAISGCSRAPMARFKEMTTAAPETTAEAPSETRATAAQRPDPRDAVADRGISREGRVSIVGDRGGRGGIQRYREGYADLRDRVLNRGTTDSRDPFLEAGAGGSAHEFPTTETLAPQREQPRSPGIDGSVARADLGADRRQPSIGAASIRRPAPQEGLARTARTESPTTSRLEQLREELRRNQTQPAADASGPIAADTPRGTVLAESNGPATGLAKEAIGVACVTPASRELNAVEPNPGAVGAPPTDKPAETRSTVGSEADGSTGELSLRIQSLLAAAEWMAERGELEQAYRNAVLAQHLADYGNIACGPEDRQPSEVAHRIWQAMDQSEDATKLAASLPKPHLPAGVTQSPVPADAFPNGRSLGWNRTEGPSSLVPIEGALPVISPRGANNGPELSAPLPTDEPAAPAEVSLEHVAGGPESGPVSIGGIELNDPAVEPGQSLPATGSPIVTALAETSDSQQADGADRVAGAEPTGLTVPAMASLPKVTSSLPRELGPALTGPLGNPEEPAEPPPYLEIMGARQLPDRNQPTDSAQSSKPAVLWGLGGLVALLLGGVYAFRHRWSAGTAIKSAPVETTSDS